MIKKTVLVENCESATNDENIPMITVFNFWMNGIKI